MVDRKEASFILEGRPTSATGRKQPKQAVRLTLPSNSFFGLPLAAPHGRNVRLLRRRVHAADKLLAGLYEGGVRRSSISRRCSRNLRSTSSRWLLPSSCRSSLSAKWTTSW